MVGCPASAIHTVALISISLIGPWFGTLEMSMASRINSTLGCPMGHPNTMLGLRAVSITMVSKTLILTIKIDQACELISSCQLSSSLYMQGGKRFHPAIVTALHNWFFNLRLPSPAMRQECSDLADVLEWKKVKRVDSEAGDLMCANAHSSGRSVRNSSYIRVFFCVCLLAPCSQLHSIRCQTAMGEY